MVMSPSQASVGREAVSKSCRVWALTGLRGLVQTVLPNLGPCTPVELSGLESSRGAFNTTLMSSWTSALLASLQG